ncbi:MAG: ABC transporter ATP-binding protein [Mycoplasmataceae bacterium]|nr:ABC transporter ATP-binding protein [Mycoplasmataceae bacterium]
MAREIIIDNKNKSKKTSDSVQKKVKANEEATLLKIENLWLQFSVGTQFNPKHKLIIRNASFELKSGQVLGLIGESGSGKTVITNTLTGLNPSNKRIMSGSIFVNDIDVTNFNEEDWEESNLRGKFISQVFQNPLSTLNPTQKVGVQIIESMKINGLLDQGDDGFDKAVEYLNRVRINNPLEVMNMYPHQLSGGMMQRVVIVAILACNPRVIIFDEPTTALDPSVQREIIELINEIKVEFNIAMIFITHDIGLVSTVATHIAIMYAGKIIEYGKNSEILTSPAHPYTWGLLQSMPEISDGKRLYSIPGAVPANLSKVKGDAFYPRNEFSIYMDAILSPPKFQLTPTHYVLSWLQSDKVAKIKKPDLIKNLEKRSKNG